MSSIEEDNSSISNVSVAKIVGVLVNHERSRCNKVSSKVLAMYSTLMGICKAEFLKIIISFVLNEV